MAKRTKIDEILDGLEPSQLAELAFAFREYNVQVNGVKREMFGKGFEKSVNAAINDNDKQGSLKATARDVIQSLIEDRESADYEIAVNFYAKYFEHSKLASTIENLRHV